jgi:hypothetical protein
MVAKWHNDIERAANAMQMFKRQLNISQLASEFATQNVNAKFSYERTFYITSCTSSLLCLKFV